MDDGIGRTLRRAAGLIVLVPLATIVPAILLDRIAAADGMDALHWILPAMSACAAAAAALAGRGTAAVRGLAWLAGAAAGSALSAALLAAPWGTTAGVVLAGLQLWQVWGVGAAVGVALAVTAWPHPPLARMALLVPLLPVTTLVTLVFVAMIHNQDRPTLGADFPAWHLTVVSAAAATVAILDGRASFPERTVAWLAATVAASAVAILLLGPVLALLADGPPSGTMLDPATLAASLWQVLGPVLAIALAQLALDAAAALAFPKPRSSLISAASRDEAPP